MLFKYLKFEHLELLMKENKIRIGSSKQYKNVGLGNMVADPDEGLTLISGQIDYVSKTTPEEYPGLAGLFHFENCSRISIVNCGRKARDFLVYCCADNYDLSAHVRWNAHQGYDACYRIDKPIEFFSLIKNALVHQCGVKSMLLGNVAYYPNSGFDIRDGRAALPPEFTKSAKSYSNQSEFRAVWPNYDLDGKSPEYFDLTIDGLNRCVSPYFRLRKTSVIF